MPSSSYTVIRSIICIFLFTLYSSLQGNLENHFKKFSKDMECHSIDQIDFIYMINLDERPEKFAQAIQDLKSHGIYPFRFSAVNGWKLSIEAINDLGVKCTKKISPPLWGTSYLNSNFERYEGIIENKDQIYFSHRLSRGAIGIVLSHLSILQDAYNSGYSTIWVMEDDIEVIDDPHKLSTLIQELDALVGKDEWDILFTDRDTKNKKGAYVPCLSFARRPNFNPTNPSRFSSRQRINKHFYQIGARYGAYSMIVRKSGMEKILNFFKNYNIFLPYDMEFTLPNDIKMYTVSKDIVSTNINAISDNGKPNYQNKYTLK